MAAERPSDRRPGGPDRPALQAPEGSGGAAPAAEPASAAHRAPARSRPAALLAVAVLVAATFAADLLLPLGVAASLPYAIAVLVSLALRRTSATLAVTALATLLTLLGILLSPAREAPLWIVATNRLLSLAAIWASAALGLMLVRERARRGRAEDSLRTGIDERDRIEDDLRRNLARTRGILDGALDGIVTIDERGRIESINPAAERIFGYTPGEVLGQDVGVLMPSPYKEEHRRYLAAYLTTGEKRIIGVGREVVGQRKDGSTFPMDLAVSEVLLGDERAFIGTVRDISERKETEGALERERDFAERLVETAPAIVLVLDLEGRIVRFNRYLEEISGYALAEVRGEDWFTTFLPPAERERIRGVFSAIVDEMPPGAVVNPILTKDGRRLAIEWHNTLLRDRETTAVLAIGQDITERLHLEDQVRQAQKMEAVGRLAGGMAHDFNTLLGAIRGYGEMLLDRLGDHEAQRRPVEQILKSAQRGANLTGQLLAFSRRQVVEPRLIDLNRLLADMGEMLSRLMREDVEVVQQLDPKVGPIKADPGQIEQVIMNLAVNASDAMPRGGRLTLKTESVMLDGISADRAAAGADGRWVVLTVSDTGIGMDAETRSQVFDPFFTTKQHGEGTGLGLSTVYGIVTQAGGTIGVESELGQGATFTVLLPQADGEVEAVEEARGDADHPGRGSETVLLVEDDEMFRELLIEVLKGHGYTVLAAGQPDAALAACDDHRGPVALLVSDVVMPGMTGGELAERLAARYPEMKVILMSGYTDDALAERGVRPDAGAFIQKPFSTREFMRTVRELLDAG